MELTSNKRMFFVLLMLLLQYLTSLFYDLLPVYPSSREEKYFFSTEIGFQLKTKQMIIRPTNLLQSILVAQKIPFLESFLK